MKPFSQNFKMYAKNSNVQVYGFFLLVYKKNNLLREIEYKLNSCFLKHLVLVFFNIISGKAYFELKSIKVFKKKLSR